MQGVPILAVIALALAGCGNGKEEACAREVTDLREQLRAERDRLVMRSRQLVPRVVAMDLLGAMKSAEAVAARPEIREALAADVAAKPSLDPAILDAADRVIAVDARGAVVFDSQGAIGELASPAITEALGRRLAIAELVTRPDGVVSFATASVIGDAGSPIGAVVVMRRFSPADLGRLLGVEIEVTDAAAGAPSSVVPKRVSSRMLPPGYPPESVALVVRAPVGP